MCKGLRTPRWKQSEYRIKIQGVRFASERFYQGDGVINGGNVDRKEVSSIKSQCSKCPSCFCKH